jgi:hypothetical protein
VRLDRHLAAAARCPVGRCALHGHLAATARRPVAGRSWCQQSKLPLSSACRRPIRLEMVVWVAVMGTRRCMSSCYHQHAATDEHSTNLGVLRAPIQSPVRYTCGMVSRVPSWQASSRLGGRAFKDARSGAGVVRTSAMNRCTPANDDASSVAAAPSAAAAAALLPASCACWSFLRSSLTSCAAMACFWASYDERGLLSL